jgi:hypothetical protein
MSARDDASIDGMQDGRQDGMRAVDPLLTRLLRAHGEAREPMPTTIRGWDDDRNLRFAEILDSAAGRFKIKLLGSGRVRWIDGNDIVEAA